MSSNAKKVAFITGGNRGLGFETARELCENGVFVIIGSRDLAKGEAAVANLKAKGLAAAAIKFEITNEADHENVKRHLESTYGRLDILVNNAAVYLDNPNASETKPNHTSTTDLQLLRDTFNTNFFEVVALTQTLLPLIRESDAGRIVNLSSIIGSLTLHTAPDSPISESKAFAYNSSKTALNAFTIHLAHELKNTKIKVNSAHPGWVKTEMGGAKAMLELQDGSKTSVKLALLPDNGPTGGFFHLDERLPW
jgi:NAD(P)-dependent dehydrogenase (short-subunit alcohol dehydrogenase family)